MQSGFRQELSGPSKLIRHLLPELPLTA